MCRRDAEQHLGRALRLPAALLPVLECINADPEQRRELVR